MIILGIDPGSRKAGYGVLEQSGKNIKYLGSGVVSCEHIQEFIYRPAHIFNEFKSILEKYRPDCVALESLVYVKNVSSLAKLSQARGAVLAAMGESYHGKLFEYSPNLIKSTVTGHGHADKSGIEKVLRMLLGPIEYKSHDESDALAIALCHALHGSSGRVPMLGEKKGQRSGRLKASLAHKVIVRERE